MNIHEPGGVEQEAALESWKEIAAYLGRQVKTVQRWEKEEKLPIHRHTHKSRSSVYAYPSEINAWRASRKVVAEAPLVRAFWRWPAFALTMLLCLIMVGNGVRLVSAQQAGAPKAARQVWVTRSSDDPLAVSPDGRFFAFTDWQTGDLAVRDMATGTNRRLTNTSGQQEAEAAVFSADGSQIAFNWFTYKEPHKEEILVIPVAGGSPRRLWSDKATGDYLVPQDWSPDGKQLLVMRGLPDRTGQLALLSVQDGSILPLKSFGWQRFNASFSPDGKLIAYDSPRAGTSGSDIFVLAADGSRETPVVQNGNDPVWSPDGSRLFFQSGRTGRNALWSIAFVNGKPGKEQLVKADLGSCSLCPGGRRTFIWMTRSGTLYYRIPGEGGPNIYTAELGAGMKVSKSPVLVIDTFVNSNNEPFLSPDAEYLAYRSGSRGLVIRTLATGEERVVTSHIPLRSGPWFPDGRSVLITSNVPQGPDSNFYRIDVATGKAELAFRSPVNAFSLSPDGKTVFYSEPFRLVRYDLETRHETELRKVDTVIDSFYSVAVSPDGKQLAYVYWNGGPTHSIEIVPAAGGPFREVFRGSPDRYGNLAWTPDGKYLLFTSSLGDDPKHALWRVPASGGQAEQTGLSMPGLNSVQVHPDGKRIFFVSNDTGPTEVWALENFLPKAGR